MQHTIRLIAALCCIFSGITTSAAMDITVKTPWVRLGPPTADVLAGYMIIHNHTQKTKTLTSLSSPAFADINIHQTTMHDGMMHMQSLDSLRIDAGKSISFEPGGYHMMLFKPLKPLGKDDHVSITLTFDDGETLEVDAPLRDDMADHSHHDSDHDSGGHQN